MQTKSKKIFLLILALTIAQYSCDSKRYYDTYKSVPNQWHKDSIVSFKVMPPDTTSLFNLFINLRTTNSYPFSNLYLITDINFPNGKVIKDTLEYQMAQPDGKLLGKGFANIKEHKLWFKEQIKFQELETYTFNIQHAMRNNGDVYGIVNLKGITDIGLRIEYANTN